MTITLMAAPKVKTIPLKAATMIIEYNASNFTPGDPIDNQYWPLMPGSVLVYYSESKDGCAVNELRVTGDTKDDFAAPYQSIVARRS